MCTLQMDLPEIIENNVYWDEQCRILTMEFADKKVYAVTAMYDYSDIWALRIIYYDLNRGWFDVFLKQDNNFVSFLQNTIDDENLPMFWRPYNVNGPIVDHFLQISNILTSLRL